MSGSFAAPRLLAGTTPSPTAHAVGYSLTLLRSWLVQTLPTPAFEMRPPHLVHLKFCAWREPNPAHLN